MKKNTAMKIQAPPDKSITHRAIILCAIAKGRCTVFNPLFCLDTLATLDCMTRLGANIETRDNKLVFAGEIKFCKNVVLNAMNSGTTMRLLTGLTSSIEDMRCTIYGDKSLNSRPQMRTVQPLNQRGAKINIHGNFAPLNISGTKLGELDFEMTIASAQVKSALLLSGLNAGGKTCIVEKGGTTRNHTELLLQAMCADIKQKDRKIMLQPSVLKSTDIRIVGDISSASYWLVLACIKPNCQITVQNVGLNPTRIGILNVFKKIGVDFTVDNVRMDCEIFGDITVRYKPHLKPFEIDSEMIPTLIDELPILSLLACFCEGKSSITGAEELRVKESDRISNIVQNLKAINADIKEDADGMTIHHSQLIGNVSLCARQDHRIAMTMEIASAVLGGIDVRDNACIAVSYPNFLDELKKINREML